MTQTLEGTPRTRGNDSRPAIEWINRVLAQRPEAQPYDFAAAAGVNRKTVANLLGPSPRPSLYSPTYERIMSTGPEDVRLSRHRVVPGTQAQQIVDDLTRQGWTLIEIAAAAGMRPGTLNRKNLTQVHLQTIARLAQAKRVLDARKRSGAESLYALEPSFRVLRRVEALMTMGWSRDEIARRAGVSRAAIRTRKTRVSASTARAVSAAFESMRFSTGNNEITRQRARQYGFAPWSAWPNGSIDVASAVPDWKYMDDKEWGERIRVRYEVEVLQTA